MIKFTPYTLTSPEAKNTGRQLELDWLKALAIITMIVVHTCLIYTPLNPDLHTTNFSTFTSTSTFDTIVVYILSFLGSGAALFMMCLGIGIVYSRRSTPIYLAKRGVILLIMGFIMNLMIYLPIILAYQHLLSIGNIVAATTLAHGLLPTDPLVTLIKILLDVNILIFAGLTLLFFSLIKLCKINNLGVVVIGLTLFAISQFIPENLFETFSIAHSVIGIFIPLDETKFTLINWIIYPIIGYIFGQTLLFAKNKAKLYTSVGIGSLIIGTLIIIGLLLANIDIGRWILSLPSLMETPLSVITEVCFMGITMALLYLLATALAKKRITKHITEISTRIPALYFIHYPLIYWLFAIAILTIGYMTLPLYCSLIVSIIFILIAYFLSPPIMKLLGKISGNKPHPSKPANHSN